MTGVVFRINDGVYLSLYNPINDSISDGIPITSNPYESLQDNQVSIVNVIIQDGTKDLLDINIDDFVYNDAIENNSNYFYKIKDLLLFTVEQNTTIREICERDEFIDMVKDMIQITLNENKQ